MSYAILTHAFSRLTSGVFELNQSWYDIKFNNLRRIAHGAAGLSTCCVGQRKIIQPVV